jgi:hypothetical protein
MTNVQIIGVSVAGAAVLLVVLALIISRRRGDEAEHDQASAGRSVLDGGPQDTFAALGRPEQPVEDITLDPALERAAAAERAAATEAELEERKPQPAGLGLDWGPDLSVRELAAQPPISPSWDDDAGVTGELRPDAEVQITDELDAAEPAVDEEPLPEDEAEVTVELGPGGPEGAVLEEGEGPEAGSHLVPLSDIIVTTSSKMVDLQDPEVRRMLTELVTFEIDQAADFRRRGQMIDAVLQLTEAEKVSRALGMTETAQRIRAMMREIDTQE